MLEVTIDEAFAKSVGQFGKGQVKLFVLVSLFWCPIALHTLVPVFTMLDPIREGYWRCKEGVDCVSVHDPCVLPRENWEWTNPTYSIASEFNLECGSAWKVEAANSIFFVGFLFGAGFFGSLADRIGRKKVLFLSTATAFLGGMLAATSPNLLFYCATRVLCGFGASGIGLTVSVLTTEWVGPDYRSAAGICSHYFYPVGVTVLCVSSYLHRRWRINQVIVALSAFLPLLGSRYIDESPRWLLIKGHMLPATKLLQKMARINGTRVPDAPLAEPRHGFAAKGEGGSPTVKQMMGHKVLRSRFLVHMFLWMAVASAYFGVNFELGHLTGSLYMNTFMSFVIEFPSLFLAYVLIDRIGRSVTLSLCFLQSGLSCVVAALATGTVQSYAAILAKFGCSAAFTLIALYCQEMFPTVVRNAVLGLASSSARIGGILAPQYVLLAEMTKCEALPFYIFAVLLIIASLLTLSLPETMGQPMPDTFQDAIKGHEHGRPLPSGWATMLKRKNPQGSPEEDLFFSGQRGNGPAAAFVQKRHGGQFRV